MWHEYAAYLIIAAAFVWTAWRFFRIIRHPEEASACSHCTADCKLRGMKRPTKEEKRRNCTKKPEKTRK